MEFYKDTPLTLADMTAPEFGGVDVLERVIPVAKKHGTTASRVALAWTAGRRGVTAPIFGPTRAEHVDDAVAALKLELAPQDIEAINSAYVPRAL